ncbi:MAG: ATP-binding protein [Muribaculaceae bacterium]|nr:ATP-binding protein [Muribaculaceae bacterium]
MMIIRRDYYLDQLIAGRGNGLIKVITGIRRCGKSFMLSHLFRKWLLDHDVTTDHILHIPLDDRRNSELRNPDRFLQYIDSLIKDEDTYYIMIDEVQMMDDFVEVLNSMLYMTNVEVYVTGSNSRFLSSDIVTEFRGRSDEIHMYPLSFKEYYSAFGGEKSESWKQYYTFGGLPQVAMLDSKQKKMTYLENLMSTVFIKDIVERHRVKNDKELEELIKIIASSIGSPTNPTKLVNTFRSLKNFVTTNKTLSKYLGYLEDAFIVKKAIRYNIKGKKYINTLAKYYFSDIGLRNASLDFRQMEETHIMENIIYNELVARGFSVDVGTVEIREKNKEGQLVRKTLEVDFVANSGNERLYIQSALSMPDDNKKKQETASFKNIDDSFKKIIIVRNDIMRYIDDNGYIIVGLFEFLLNHDAY